MSGLRKPKYMKICDIHKILNYIFNGHKRPHFVQLNPKPKLVVIINLKTEFSEAEHENCEDLSQLTASSSGENSDSVTDKIKEKNGVDKSLKAEGDVFDYLRLDFRAHINENIKLNDLFKNLLKSVDVHKTTLNLITPENLNLIEKHDINHIFSYSCFIKSQTDFDTSTFTTYLKPVKITQYFLVAIDCEMMICKNGKQLGRITILDNNGSVIYDTYIRPQSEVVDYLEKYSGLNSINTGNGVDMSQMHRDILEIVGTTTFLVGHGLENDLEAMNFYTEKLIDTSYLFLSSEGYKIKLSQLSKKLFGSVIQEKSHSSKEDAFCCLKLLAYKIGQLKNFYDPCGEKLKFPVEVAEAKDFAELRHAKGIRFLETDDLEAGQLNNDNSVFYLVFYSIKGEDFIRLRQNNK